MLFVRYIFYIELTLKYEFSKKPNKYINDHPEYIYLQYIYDRTYAELSP